MRGDKPALDARRYQQCDLSGKVLIFKILSIFQTTPRRLTVGLQYYTLYHIKNNFYLLRRMQNMNYNRFKSLSQKYIIITLIITL